MNKKTLILIVFPLILTSCKTNQGKYIAHRGYHVSNFVENTKEAFIEAGRLPFFGIETDVRFTIDNVAVCNHDSKLFGTDMVISEYTFDELKDIDLDNDETREAYLTTFDEYLEVAKEYEKVPFIEFKEDEDLDKVRFIINKAEEMFDYYCPISFKDGIMEKLELLAKEKEYHFESFRLCQAESSAMKALNKGYNIDIKDEAYTSAVELLAKTKKAKVGVWTVNDSNDAKKLINRGAEFVTSDTLYK